MGKVRILLVKRVAKKMIEKYPEKFSRDFDQNKKSLEELKLTRRLRNRIAGYISSLLTPSKIPVVAVGEEKPIFAEGDEEFEAEGVTLNQEGEAVPGEEPRVQADEAPEKEPPSEGAAQ